jgi:hypothetical protein
VRDYSNYHNVNINDKIISDGNLILDQALNGFEGYDVVINGVAKKVVIQSKNSYNTKGDSSYIIGKKGDFDIGSIVEHDSKTWLVPSHIDDIKIYVKGIIRLCNSILTIPGDTTKTQTGTDSMGRPIYSETTSPSTSLPCIAESKVYMSQDQEPINLPNGRLVVTIPFTDNGKIKLNFEFDMYGNRYKISHLDRSQVIGTVGILQLTADLVQGG